MKKLLEYIRPFWSRITVGLCFKFVGTIAELWLPWILTYLLDEVVPKGVRGPIYMWGILMLICSGVACLFNILANRSASAVARDTTRGVRHGLYSRIAYLSCAQIDKIGVPSLVSRLTTDTYNVHQMVGMIQRMGVRAPILLIGGIMMTLSLDVPLTMVLIAIIPIAVVSVTYVSMKGVPLFRRLQESVDSLILIIRENITGARVIKALSRNEYETKRFEKQNKVVSGNEMTANIVMGLGRPIMNVLMYLGMVLVIIYGAYRVDGQLMKPAIIVAFLSYFTQISNAVMGLTRIFVIVSRASASANRIQEIMDMPMDLENEEAEAGDEQYHVEFDHVTFSYNKRKPTVTDINFKLKRGESIGIIGATGSGKTTIINLLMRFYDVDQGAVRIGGRDVRTIPDDELHRMFGVAFQNDVVFSDTVKENILLGRNISDEAVERAIDDAQAREFISGLPDGLSEHMNAQGTNLSGGQRQRLLISRALAGIPDILVLDDSSSALDYRTDANLRLALAEGYQDVTSVIIASRVSSIKNCTQIIVLDAGKVIGQGTHAELLKSCPVYADIAKTQMGGGVNE